MPKGKISRYGWTVITISAAVIVLLATVAHQASKLGREHAELIFSPPEGPTVPPIIIEVDGVNCVIAETPTLIYYVATDSVRVTIECDSDILMHYLPAIVPGE